MRCTVHGLCMRGAPARGDAGGEGNTQRGPAGGKAHGPSSTGEPGNAVAWLGKAAEACTGTRQARTPPAGSAPGQPGEPPLAWHALDEDCLLFLNTLASAKVRGSHWVQTAMRETSQWLHARRRDPAVTVDHILAKRLEVCEIVVRWQAKRKSGAIYVGLAFPME